MSGTTHPSYSRQALICGADMLKALGHSGLDRFLLELELPDDTVGRGSGLTARATSLAQFAIKNPAHLSPERRTVAYEIIRRATQLWHEGASANLSAGERDKFAAAMQREGQGAWLEPGHEAIRPSLTLGGEDEGNGWVGASMTFSGSDLDRLRGVAMAEQPFPAVVRPAAPSVSKKVFVVHGHDEAALQGVARFLEKLGLQATILREQPDQGRTIIEKFEDHAVEVGFAVVLLTPDDVGSAAAASSQDTRARQNVIFELGYFAGRLGRGKTCLMRKGAVEIPSDLYGVIYTDLDPAGAWKMKLVQEMRAAKLDFDPNKMWT